MDVDGYIAIFTGITAIATVFAAYLAWKSAQPLISVMNQMDENNNLVMDLVVENIGSGIAYDVKFEAIPDFKISVENLSEIGLFKNGLRYFPPRQKIKLFLKWMPEDYENVIKNPFEIRVSYDNWIGGWLGSRRVDNFLIDLSLFGVHPLPENPLSKIAKSLENIENRIKPAIQFDKIKVIAYTKDEQDEEFQDMIRRASEKRN